MLIAAIGVSHIAQPIIDALHEEIVSPIENNENVK